MGRVALYPPEGANALHCAMMSLCEAIADNALLRGRAESLRERLERQHFQLAVLGQFKRGKSTFINALLGAPLLPIAVIPLTAVAIFISWRSASLVRIRFTEGRADEELLTEDPDAIRQFLFRFVSEEANPQNHLNVKRVDLFYPAPILADGIILIDTPGVGSTHHHNTETALRVLPECDAALFVISVDPPITEIEIKYLQRISAKTAKLFFILNKIDYLRREERSQVTEFVKRTLEQHDLWSPETAIFSVSAAEGLESKRQGDQTKLTSSGIAEVERHLLRDLASQKGRLLQQAVRIKAGDILSEAIAEVRLQIRALQMPLEELAGKCDAFGQTLVSIEGQRRTIRDLLEGERRRLREQLEERTTSLRNEARAKLTKIVDLQIQGTDTLQELGEAITEIFDSARQEFFTSFASLIESTLTNHQRQIGALVADVRRTAGELFNTPFQTGFQPDSFTLGEDPYWVTEKIQTTLLPDVSSLVDRLLPGHICARRRRARILRQVNELILRNAENLRWAILRGINETFGKASLRFEEHLDNTITTTNGIVRDALERRRTSSSAVGDEMNRLQRKDSLLCDLQKQFRAAQEDQAREVEGTK